MIRMSGVRGVYLRDYDRRLASNNNVAPAGWTFDPSDWWVEEHGLIMSTPEPLSRRRYDKEGLGICPSFYLLRWVRQAGKWVPGWLRQERQ